MNELGTTVKAISFLNPVTQTVNSLLGLEFNHEKLWMKIELTISNAAYNKKEAIFQDLTWIQMNLKNPRTLLLFISKAPSSAT